jgi:hypothetical protein
VRPTSGSTARERRLPFGFHSARSTGSAGAPGTRIARNCGRSESGRSRTRTWDLFLIREAL